MVLNYEAVRTLGFAIMSLRKRSRPAPPTDFELRILKVLWKHGGKTAREVLELLPAQRALGYTTVLKMLQIMEQKRMVAVDRTERAHVFSARIEEAATLGRLAAEFVD